MDKRKQIKKSFLADAIASSVPLQYCLPDDRPEVQVGYVEPSLLLPGAHLVWEDHDSKACLYLGPERSAGKDARESLNQAKIGAIVNCTTRSPCYHRDEGIQYCQVRVNDELGANIVTYLEGATMFIHHQLRHGSSVLVHCEMGVSRSATIVIAYLVRYHGLSRNEAYVQIKTRRPKISPNGGFWQQLRVWEHRVANNMTESRSDESSRNPVDAEWAQSSSALYSTCCESDGMMADLLYACFQRCKSADLDQVLFVALDFIWGRGVLGCDVDWLVALCGYLEEHNETAEQASATALRMLTSSDSKFTLQWSGEVYPEQIERVQNAFADCSSVS